MRRSDVVIEALLLAALVTCAALWVGAVCAHQNRSIDAAHAALRK